MMKEQLKTMMRLQDDINSQVNPDWRAQNNPWYRAIWTESAEMLDHVGWKWWKHQQPDTPQVVLELIDIWHFGLSILLQNAKDAEHVEVLLAPVLGTTSDEDIRTLIEDFAQSTLATQDFDLIGFAKMMNAVGLTFDGLYKNYVGKNVLNRFRQDNGYKDGTYLKVWNGREDNEHLAELLNSIDDADPAFIQTLAEQLHARYPNPTN